MNANKMNGIVQRLLLIKKSRENVRFKKEEHYREFKKELRKEQELTRQLNELIENLEEFRE